MTVIAHGVGSRHDLPIPLFYAFVGALAAVFVSFLAVALLWSESRFRGAAAGRPVPLSVVDSQPLRWALRLIGLVACAVVVVLAVLGPDDPDANPTARIVYVVFWVGLVPASLLLGPVWKLLNPLRTIHLLVGAPGRRQVPVWVGYWPAAVSLFAFTWLELVSPEPASTRSLLVFFGTYGVVHLAAACWFGVGWFARGDGFEVYSTLIGQLAPLGRRDDGRIVLRNPLDGLDAVQPAPGLVAVVGVLLGSTFYDGFSDAPAWVDVVQSGALGPVATGTLGLVGAIVLVTGLYGLCLGAASAMTGQRGLPGRFAHSLIPIAVGYLVAHYFSLFVFDGQRTLILLSDPLDTGADLFGVATRSVDLSAVSPTTIAVVQVLAIVAGHVLGVIAAHDRSVRLLPAEHAVAGQLPLLVLMLCYTVGGLVLLFVV